MPIYEYRCESCEGRFERLVAFAERDTAQPCPTCASSRTRVLVSSFAFAGTGGDDGGEMSFSGGGGCCGGSCGCGCSAN